MNRIFLNTTAFRCDHRTELCAVPNVHARMVVCNQGNCVPLATGWLVLRNLVDVNVKETAF